MRPAKWILAGIIILVGLLITLKSFEYYTPDFTEGFLMGRKEIFATTLYAPALYIHISISTCILFCGLVQFASKRRIWHKPLGKFYVFGILVFSAPGAFAMGYYAHGPWWLRLNFMLLASLWFYTTWMAYTSIHKKDISAHQLFMQRSYILTLSAIFLRLYTYLFMGLLELPSPEAYYLSSILSWLPNILLFELLRKKRTA